MGWIACIIKNSGRAENILELQNFRIFDNLIFADSSGANNFCSFVPVPVKPFAQYSSSTASLRDKTIAILYQTF